MAVVEVVGPPAAGTAPDAAGMVVAGTGEIGTAMLEVGTPAGIAAATTVVVGELDRQ